MKKELVEKLLREAVKATFQIDTHVELVLSDPRRGDYSSNISFALAKETGLTPLKVAEKLTKSIQHAYIEKVEAKAPGFINITLSDEYWVQIWQDISLDYLKNQLGQGQKVQVEFISANPTGPLTLGNARGGFIGDVLANVLSISGFDVTQEYYFNDAGTQISKLVESVKAEAGLIKTKDRQYSGAYIKELTKQFTEEITTKTDKELGKVLTQAIFEKHIKPAIQKMGIEFNCWFNESDLEKENTETEKLLRSGDLLYEEEGAIWLKSSSYGDERDRVLVKANGDRTYLANDISYHYNIFRERKYKNAIKVWGSDHAGQVPSLRLTVDNLFPDVALEFIIVQWVRLIKDGKEVKISKREGTFITVDELIEEVGSDVARFFMLMRSNDTHMDFDLDLAKEESQKNPLWYIQYAYVRALSILEQAGASGLKPHNLPKKLTPLEKELGKALAELPQLVKRISKTYEVHKLAFWGMETAKIFHEFYESERIIDMEKVKAEEKLGLVEKFTVAMGQYFAAIGIEPRSKM
ncbi:MAG: arginine--tRNA ligase [Candidatus Saccharimonadales bacterium]